MLLEYDLFNERIISKAFLVIFILLFGKQIVKIALFL